jgi:hypothetical protein
MREIRLHHGLEYPDNHGITLSDVAATLLAHERLLPIVAELMESLTPGLAVENISIELDRLQSGSLSEAFFVAIFLAFQKDLETEVPEWVSSITGIEVSDRYDTIVTVLFIVALYAGVRLLLDRTKKQESTGIPGVHFEGDYNTYVNIAADQLGVTPGAVKRAVDRAIGKARIPTVARAAIDLFRPAKRGEDGRIIPRGLPEISRESVREFPSQLAFMEMDRDTMPFPIPVGTLRIRATDRDKFDKGWAGKIEFQGSITKRLPLVLAPQVDPDQLAAMDSATVEAILENRMTDDGRTKPLRIHVMRILDS